MTARAGRDGPVYGSGGNVVFDLRLKHLEFEVGHFTFWSLNKVAESDLPSVLIAEPKRTHQRNLRTAANAFAAHRACPDVSKGTTTIRVGRVEPGQFFLRRLFDLCHNM